MIKLNYLYQLGFNFDSKYRDEKELIKLQKLLNAESKINPEFYTQDAEILNEFLKANWQDLEFIKNNNNINAILSNNDNYKIEQHQIKLYSEHLKQYLILQEQFFTENIQQFLSKNLKTENWAIIIDVYTQYKFLFSLELDEYLLKEIELIIKNNLSNIQNGILPPSYVKTKKHYTLESEFYEFIVFFFKNEELELIGDFFRKSFNGISNAKTNTEIQYFNAVFNKTKYLLNNITTIGIKSKLYKFLLLKTFFLVVALKRLVLFLENKKARDYIKNFIILILFAGLFALFYWFNSISTKLFYLHLISCFLISRISKLDDHYKEEKEKKIANGEIIYNEKTWKFRSLAMYSFIVFFTAFIITIPGIGIYYMFKFLGTFLGVSILVGLFIALAVYVSKKGDGDN